MTYRPFFLLLLLPAFISACSTSRMREEVASPPEKETFYSTQVALGECALIKEGDEVAPLLGLLAANAISEGVNRIGIALNEAAQKKEVSVSSVRNIEVSKESFSAKVPCLQLVRGWFYRNPKREGKGDLASDPKITAALKWTDNENLMLKSVITLWRNGIWLAARPDFIFEGVFASSKDGKAQTVIPHYVEFNEPLFTRLFRPGRIRHIAVFFAFHKPSDPAEMPTHPAASFVLGKFEPKAKRHYPYNQTILDERLPPLPGKPKAILNRWPHESEWFDTLDLGNDPQPLKLSALVTEMEDESKFLGFVAAVFGGSKEEITKEFQNTFIPDKRQAAAVEKARNETELEEKIDEAIGTLKACSITGTATIQTATAARKALREINARALAANKGLLVKQSCIDKINQTDEPATIAQACSTILGKVQSERLCSW